MDELRPKEQKEMEAARKAKRKEELRVMNTANSKETQGVARQGRGTDPTRSIPAQGRMANAAQAKSNP